MYRDHRGQPQGNEYVRHGQSPLRKSPIRPLHAGASQPNLQPPSAAQLREMDQKRTSLDDGYQNLLRKWRYHESRLATEVALLKFNTPYEKREHSASSHSLREKKTAASSAANQTKFEMRTSSAIGLSSVGKSRASDLPPRCQCSEKRGRSPLQDIAYRPTLYEQRAGSLTRPNSLLPSSSQQVLPSTYEQTRMLGGFGERLSFGQQDRIPRRDMVPSGGPNGYPGRESPLREKRGSVSCERQYDLIERKYLADKLQSQIELRERRLVELEAKERFLRDGLQDRENERPLRRGSCSRERKVEFRQSCDATQERQMRFETDAEREAALRRRKVLEETAPVPDSSVSGDKEVDWLNQVSSGDRRSNSNSDQIGIAKQASRQKDFEGVDQTAQKSKGNANELSLEYSESEQLQFSHPPKMSKGPSEIQIQESPERDEDAEGPEDDGTDEPDVASVEIQRQNNYMLNSVTADSQEELQRDDLVRQLKNNFVKKREPARDPYVNRVKDQKLYAKKLQKDLKNLSGDPKNMKRIQKLSKSQLELLKEEQLRQLYDEREVLRTQNEEIDRLKWLNKKLNHSHGLKNRHEAAKRRPRSRSSEKRAFVQKGEYQDWTNTFKRMTLHWDDQYGLLEQEKGQVKSVKKLEKHPTRCCGNSPGKQHTTNCNFDKPGASTVFRVPGRATPTTACLSTAKKQKTKSASKGVGMRARLPKHASVIKSGKKSSNQKFVAFNLSTKKSKGVARTTKKQQKLAESTSGQHIYSQDGQVLYNIDSHGRAISMIKPQNQRSQQQIQPVDYSEKEKQALYGEDDDAYKVQAIANKIRELTQSTNDPVVRDKVLSESKVKFNGQIMTLKDFLGICGHQIQESQQQDYGEEAAMDADYGPEDQEAQYAM